MTVTVVVASRDRRADLLASLPRHEAPVILVDNGSTDATVAAVRSAFPAVRILPLARNVGALARTIGARAATTPYVAFADDDSWWAPGALARAVELLETGWLLSYVDDLVVHHHPSPTRGSPAHRRTQVVRSALLTACMRRPWRDVLGLAIADLRGDGPSRRGVLTAVPSLPGALIRRRRISTGLRHRLAALATASSGVAGSEWVTP